MKLAWKVLFVLLALVFVREAEAAKEWVQIYRPDVSCPEWVKINTGKRPGQIMQINGGSLVVNIGIKKGARKGGLFLVYSERNRATAALAIIRVAQTAAEFSLCEMTPYVVGGEVCVGDLVAPASIYAERDVVLSGPPAVYKEYVTEGFVSTPRVYGVPPNVAAAVTAPVVTGVPAAVSVADAYVTSQLNVTAPIPAPAPIPTPVAGPAVGPAYAPQTAPTDAPAYAPVAAPITAVVPLASPVWIAVPGSASSSHYDSYYCEPDGAQNGLLRQQYY